MEITYYTRSSRNVRRAQCVLLAWKLFWVVLPCHATTTTSHRHVSSKVIVDGPTAHQQQYYSSSSASQGIVYPQRNDPPLAEDDVTILAALEGSSSLMIADRDIVLSQQNRVIMDVLGSNDDDFVFANKDEPPANFCEGMYMTMFMDGFHWSLFLRPSPQCLNYFVQSWRLDNASKFRGAMLFTFLLAILVEGLSSARSVLVRSNHNFLADRQHQHLALTAIYAVQTLLGYILMLVTMSFSIELFLSVVTGLMVGNLLFIRYSSSSSHAIDGNNDNATTNLARPSRNNAGSSYANTQLRYDDSDDPESSPLLGQSAESGNMSSATSLRRRG